MFCTFIIHRKLWLGRIPQRKRCNTSTPVMFQTGMYRHEIKLAMIFNFFFPFECRSYSTRMSNFLIYYLFICEWFMSANLQLCIRNETIWWKWVLYWLVDNISSIDLLNCHKNGFLLLLFRVCIKYTIFKFCMYICTWCTIPPPPKKKK